MDIVMILSTVILIATLATLVLAVGSYVAFKMRDRRRPRLVATGGAPAKTFFARYRPVGAPVTAAVATDRDR